MSDTQAISASQEHLGWQLARGMIEEFLPSSPWGEEVLELDKGLPGRLEIEPATAHRRYRYPACRLLVRRVADGEQFERRYSFAFDWCEGRWQLVELPAVG
jgi:hypothetical protein